MLRWWRAQETELVAAGFPCVDVSRAGLRKGMEGKVRCAQPAGHLAFLLIGVLGFVLHVGRLQHRQRRVMCLTRASTAVQDSQ